MSKFTLYQGSCFDVLPQLPVSSVHACVTSPPYFGLRDYEVEGQLGQERTVEDFVSNLVAVFRQVRRVLRSDGSLWLNLGDSYCRSDNKRQNLKKGDLSGVPWAVALAMREDGWFLRGSQIWEKTNSLPESVKDRPTKCHEYVFLLSASRRYYYDQAAVAQPVAPNTLKRHKQAVQTRESQAKAVPVGDTRIARMNPNYRRKSAARAFIWAMARGSSASTGRATSRPKDCGNPQALWSITFTILMKSSVIMRRSPITARSLPQPPCAAC